MGELLRGKTVAQLTSGTPANARTGAAWAAQHGVNYLDGAILAEPSMTATDYATVFYAGDRTVFDAHKPTLQVLASNTVFVADAIGSAAALDCAILEAYYGVVSLSFTLRPCVSPKESLRPGSSNTSEHLWPESISRQTQRGRCSNGAITPVTSVRWIPM